MSAKIASDGQWRFPASEKLPYKIEKSILTFEDEYFYWHPGFNPMSIAKAVYDNIKSGKIKRGGSTISMQTIRLWLENPSRTYFQKIKELVLVLGLEMNFSKKEILSLYVNNAPFGGNVVGVESASWRYFNRNVSELSWAEASTLAVLPNSPSLIHFGRNRDKLIVKRNFILKKLFNKSIIDKQTYELALLETIPNKPYSLPNFAPHLLELIKKRENPISTTTIDYDLQNKVISISKRHISELSQNKIFNLAIIVIDIKTNEVISYVGNSYDKKSSHSNYVDIIQSARSTGSILKPFLYAAAYDKGLILPNTLIADIPTNYNGFNPVNYDKNFHGAVPAGECLSRSLNIPSVRLLRDYGIEPFYKKLQDLKLTNINRGANNYGLSMILGGAESSLWNLSRAYSWLARNQNEYVYGNEPYLALTNPKVELNEKDIILNSKKIFSRGATFEMFEQLKDVNRPEVEAGWTNFGSSGEISWKTGTSHGFKDAWSIGWDNKKLVGVWVGNANGEGRPGILGVGAAAPIMFDIFSLLPNKGRFPIPHEELVEIETCRKSGMKAGKYCTEVDTILAPVSGLKSEVCKFHKLIHLDSEKRYRVNSNCYPVSDIKNESFFVLPSVQAWYYKKKNINYKQLPPWKEGCTPLDEKIMEWIYPNEDNKIFIPKNKYGEKSKVVFELAHQKKEAVIYWHLDDIYQKTTTKYHTFSFNTTIGKHVIKCIDVQGNSIVKHFEILSK